MKPVDHLDRAVQLLDGLEKARCALELKSYQTLQQWRKNRVPAEYCPKIEQLTDRAVLCEQLRPDVDWAVLRSPQLGAGETAPTQEVA